MKKIILMPYLLIIFHLSSCNKLEGTRGFSSSIAESKRNKTFISEFSSNQTEYKFGDSITFKVKEVFLEHGWGHGNNKEPILDRWNGPSFEEMQLVMIVEDLCCESGVVWSIEQKDGGGFSYYNHNKYASTIASEEVKDTLVYNVIRDVNLKGEEFDRNILGSISFIRKDKN